MLFFYKILDEGGLLMTKLIYDNSAKLCLLNEEEVQKIHATALQILSEVGVLFECEEALDYLEAAGCRVERQKKIVTYPEELVLAAIQSFSSSPNYF